MEKCRSEEGGRETDGWVGCSKEREREMSIIDVFFRGFFDSENYARRRSACELWIVFVRDERVNVIRRDIELRFNDLIGLIFFPILSSFL